MKRRLELSPKLTYEKLAQELGCTRARICQYLTLLKRLPMESIRRIEHCTDPAVLQRITERRLRSITEIADAGLRRREIRDLLSNP